MMEIALEDVNVEYKRDDGKPDDQEFSKRSNRRNLRY